MNGFSGLALLAALAALQAWAQPAPPDLRPENALQRIKARNLFHPNRGAGPKAGSPESPSIPRPTLVGTLMQPKHRKALLRWPGSEELEALEEGKESKDFRILRVETQRVELKYLPTGDTFWVKLDEAIPEDRGKPSGPRSGVLENLEKAGIPPLTPRPQEKNP